MPRQLARLLVGLCLGLVIASASAANLIIYDDQSENGFDEGCSFPSPSADFNFADTAVVHSAPRSIRFTPDNNNAVSWCTPATYSAVTNYSSIDFWVNGSTTGSQNVNLVLGLAGNPVRQASLTVLNGGNPVAAGAWTHITAPFTSGAMAYNGSFDQISLQDESGAVQANMYFDDVSLIPAAGSAGPVQNAIFTDSFEPEYMFVPQYTTGSIKVYQRVINPGANPQFTLINTASLGAGVKPNAVAFAPDGHLWVVDDGGNPNKLLRYSLAVMLTDANPVPSVVVGLSNGPTEVFDMSFFGDYAYVSRGFNGADAVLKFALSDLGTSGFIPPVATLTNADLNPPVGLAFDPQGRLWISTYDHNKILRMDNTGNGHIDRIGTNVATAGGNSLKNVEGLAFDQYGTLWAANNGEFTISAYTDAQLNSAGFGATSPVYQILTPTANQHPGPDPVTGEAGGVAFDKNGSLWVNFEYSWSVLEYSLASVHAQPGAGDYSTTLLPTLSSATTDPGFGGIAFWPRPNTVHIK